MARKSKTPARDTSGAPLRRTCGAMQVHNRLLEQHPQFRLRQGQIEHATAARLAGGAELRAGITTIPVVVHVVYNTAADNISNAQVTSQIDALNRDYAAKNSDRKKVPGVWKGLVTNARIQFALATHDPAGKPSDGIQRVKTKRASFGDDDHVKSRHTGGADAWPADRYLNLWVCTLGGGLLGYAQFPGGPAATDGVVILNKAFGTKGSATAPFNLGRTAVHEVGHWLNLRHIWGDTEDCSGTDYVADTPNAQHPNYNKPKFPHVSCSNGPSGDMFTNYMDYVDDDAMVMFTAGQVARMQAALDTARSAIGV
jgi:pregnancy-associated plasma protein-A